MEKPASAEEEYFARENAERLRKLAADQRASLDQAERARLRELHHAHCPNCGMDLHEVNYRGVKVQRCFDCNGTFLAAGELDKVARAEPHGVMHDFLRLFEHKHK
jgi:uncharacterized protein